MAFTSTGELKSRLQPRKKWVESNDTQRLYVAGKGFKLTVRTKLEAKKLGIWDHERQ